MQFPHSSLFAKTLSARVRRGFRPLLVAGVFSIVGLLLCGAPLRGQTEGAMQAPWQEYPGPEAAGYGMGRPSRPMSRAVQQPVYEGIGEMPCDPCADDCETCDVECRWPGTRIFRDCPNPFLDCLWFRGEYLMWWDKSGDLPPLATTSVAGTPRNQAGILGLADTSTVIGGQGFEMGLRTGARLTLGCWTNPCHDEAVEATYMFFGSDKRSFRETSDDYPILARPFYNAQLFRQDAVVLAYPNQQTGRLSAAATNEFASLSLLYRKVVFGGCCGSLDFLAGYRYGRFAENLAVDASTTYVSRVGVIPVGTVIDTSDWFRADNEFHGGELGLSLTNRYCRWSFEGLAKVALGSTRSRTCIRGATTVAVPPLNPVSYAGGMLALPTNSGKSQESGFAAIPEFGVNIGYDVTPRLKATVGYTFIYWSRIARPADQIDPSLNPTQFPPGTLVGFPAPEPKFVLTDYWAQGLNVGLDYRY